jgi:hypothetical protein
MSLNKYSPKNKSKNATTIHKNSLQYKLHPYTTRVLRKCKGIVHNMSDMRIKDLQKMAWKYFLEIVLRVYTTLEEPKSFYLDLIPVFIKV